MKNYTKSEIISKFNNPDNIWHMYENITFAYLDNELFYKKDNAYGITHFQLFNIYNLHRKLGFTDEEFEDDKNNHRYAIHEQIRKKAILGRTALNVNLSVDDVPIDTITSFWYSTENIIFSSFIKNCISELVNKSLIKLNDLLIIKNSPVYVSEALGMKHIMSNIYHNDDDYDSFQKHNDKKLLLHLMKGNEKKTTIIKNWSKTQNIPLVCKSWPWNKTLVNSRRKQIKFQIVDK